MEDRAQDDGVSKVSGGPVLPAAPSPAAAGRSSARATEEHIHSLLVVLAV